MDIDKRNLSIIERLEELRDLMKIGMDKVTLQDAMDEIERLREAAKDRPKDRPKDAADEIERLREALKNMLRWHDQLSPADIAKAEVALKDNQ